LAQIRLVVFRKMQKTHTLIPKNDVTEPKAKLLYKPNNQLNCQQVTNQFQLPKTMVSGSPKLLFNLLTAF